MDDTRRRLLWHGMFLFLLGLLTGLVEQKFANPRMGLAAHLEGVMNGTLLVALGAVWADVRLSPGLKAAAYWSALYGTYANWAVTTPVSATSIRNRRSGTRSETATFTASALLLPKSGNMPWPCART